MLRFPRPDMLDFRGKLSGFLPQQTIAGRAVGWASLAVLAAHWLMVARFVLPRSGDLSFLRLHYSVDFGVDWVGSWWYIWAYPGLGTVAAILNFRLADALVRLRPALGTMTLVATLLLQLMFVTGGAFAILLNS